MKNFKKVFVVFFVGLFVLSTSMPAFAVVYDDGTVTGLPPNTTISIFDEKGEKVVDRETDDKGGFFIILDGGRYTLKTADGTIVGELLVPGAFPWGPAIFGVVVGGTALGVGLSQGDDGTATGTGNGTETDTGGDTDTFVQYLGSYTGDNGCGLWSATVNSIDQTSANVHIPGNGDVNLTGNFPEYSALNIKIFDVFDHLVRIFFGGSFTLNATNQTTGGTCSEVFTK